MADRLVGGIDQFHDSESVRSGGFALLSSQEAIAKMFKHREMTVLNKMFVDRVVVEQRASSFARATKSGPNRMTRQKVQMGVSLRSKNFKSAIETAC